jgi:hypothetical protein
MLRFSAFPWTRVMGEDAGVNPEWHFDGSYRDL